MARISIAEIERIAGYKLSVDSLGDGERKVYATLDISRLAIEADHLETILGSSAFSKSTHTQQNNFIEVFNNKGDDTYGVFAAKMGSDSN